VVSERCNQRCGKAYPGNETTTASSCQGLQDIDRRPPGRKNRKHRKSENIVFVKWTIHPSPLSLYFVKSRHGTDFATRILYLSWRVFYLTKNDFPCLVSERMFNEYLKQTSIFLGAYLEQFSLPGGVMDYILRVPSTCLCGIVLGIAHGLNHFHGKVNASVQISTQIEPVLLIVHGDLNRCVYYAFIRSIFPTSSARTGKYSIQ
jgi:hypothetical protein